MLTPPVSVLNVSYWSTHLGGIRDLANGPRDLGVTVGLAAEMVATDKFSCTSITLIRSLGDSTDPNTWFVSGSLISSPLGLITLKIISTDTSRDEPTFKTTCRESRTCATFPRMGFIATYSCFQLPPGSFSRRSLTSLGTMSAQSSKASSAVVNWLRITSSSLANATR